MRKARVDALQWLVVVLLESGEHAQACAFPSPCITLPQMTDGETAWLGTLIGPRPREVCTRSCLASCPSASWTRRNTRQALGSKQRQRTDLPQGGLPMSVQPCPRFTSSSFQPSIFTPSLSSGTTPTLGTATISEAFIHPRVH